MPLIVVEQKSIAAARQVVLKEKRETKVIVIWQVAAVI